MKGGSETVKRITLFAATAAIIVVTIGLAMASAETPPSVLPQGGIKGGVSPRGEMVRNAPRHGGVDSGDLRQRRAESAPSQKDTSETTTYEGELDPNLFSGWPVVGSGPAPMGPPFLLVTIQNPDEKSGIKHVVVLIMTAFDGAYIMSYGYEKDGLRYFYRLDTEANKYVRYYPQKPMDKEAGADMVKM